MNIITLTTDFGYRDYSVGVLKGQLYRLLPDVTIVDISHDNKTIHIIGVNNELNPERPLLILDYNNHYFITADNGFISLFVEEQTPYHIYKVNLKDTCSSFPTLDFSTKVAQLIRLQTPIEEIGTPYQEHLHITNFLPKVLPNRIEGTIIHIDHFGNLVSNITQELLEKEAKGRKFNVYFRYESIKNIGLEDIYLQYNQAEEKEIPEGNKMLIFNKLKYLEMTLYKSDPSSSRSAASLMGIKRGNTMSIDFI